MRRIRLSIGFIFLLTLTAAFPLSAPASGPALQDAAGDSVDELAGARLPGQNLSFSTSSGCGNCGCAGSGCSNCGCAGSGCGSCGCGDCGCESQCQNYACCLAPAAVDPYCRLMPQNGFISVRGWLDAGILGNTSNPASHFNGPYNSQEVDNGQFNQAYLIMERALQSDGSFSVGGRLDLLYGADYFEAQSNGVERQPSGAPRWNSSQYYGLAMPQAYLEAGTTQASLKMGHFYTVVGYESVQAANNFFYSHAYSYQFAGPFTQWGGLANWHADENWQTQFGLVNGWNTLSGPPNRVNFLSNVKYTSDSGSWWSSFAIITGDQQDNPANLPTVNNANTNRTRYSFIISKKLSSRVEYVFHQWAGAQQQGAPGGGTAKWYGLDQYLYYRLNDAWRVGTRVEWFRDQDGTRVGLTEPSNPNQAPLPGTYASWTVGANWQARPNLMLRPELRWDTYSGTAKPFDDGHKTSQFLLGLDALVQF